MIPQVLWLISMPPYGATKFGNHQVTVYIVTNLLLAQPITRLGTSLSLPSTIFLFLSLGNPHVVPYGAYSSLES